MRYKQDLHEISTQIEDYITAYNYIQDRVMGVVFIYTDRSHIIL